MESPPLRLPPIQRTPDGLTQPRAATRREVACSDPGQWPRSYLSRSANARQGRTGWYMCRVSFPRVCKSTIGWPHYERGRFTGQNRLLQYGQIIIAFFLLYIPTSSDMDAEVYFFVTYYHEDADEK
jgi:hypothetical protein